MTIETDTPQEEKPKGDSVWTTVFEINPDAFLEVQRILDMLRHKNTATIDPKVAEEESKDLFGE